MKDFFSKSKGLFCLLLGFLIFFFFFYSCHFSGGLSSEHDKWSQFGDFFNGVISPIFAAINICIFWYLTKVIDLNNDKRQKEMLKKEKELQKEMQDYEDKRQQQIEANENKRQQQIQDSEDRRQQEIQKNENKRQEQIEANENKRQRQIQDNEDRRQRERLEHEKAILIMQFRKIEVDKLNEVMQVSKEDLNNTNFLLLLSHWGITVDYFLKSKLVFFGLNENSKIAENLHALNNELSEIIKEYPNWLMYCNFFDSFRKKPDAEKYIAEQKVTFSKAKECFKRMSDHFKIAMEQKTSIINDLQKITLGEKIS